jgi:hypothetical protein
VDCVAFRTALPFLLRHRDETGRLHGFLHSTWIAAAVFLMCGQNHADAASAALSVLLSQPPEEWEDSQLCWALDCLGRVGLPKAHPFVEAALAELCRRQSPDGRWSSEDGETHTVGATIEALKVLKHWGLLANPSS